MNRGSIRRAISLLLALVMALSLCSFAWADGEKATVVDDVLSATLAQELAVLSAPAYTSGGQDEWVVLGLARSGYLEKGSKYFDDYYSRTVTAVDAAAKGVKAPVGALSAVKCTENSRLIIALSAIGRDAAHVGSWDLLAPYEDYNWIIKQGLNSVIFALIALDAADHQTKADIRGSCIAYILSYQKEDGGWNYMDTAASSDADMTAMALQALAGYTDQPKVSAAVEKALAWLSKTQNADGSYSSGDAVNCESTAQVVTACAALGIDPHTDSRFVKNGKSAVDALLSFYDSALRAFRHVKKDNGTDGMATNQAAYAMTAYQRLARGQNSLYNMSDVRRDCADGNHVFGEARETEATCTMPKLRTYTCTVCGRSRYEVLSPALGHRTASGYSISDTAHWFTCAVCGVHVSEGTHKYIGDQCTVCGYHKLGGRIQVTELTAVPASLQGIDSFSTLARLQSAMLAKLQKVDRDITRSTYTVLDVSFLVPDAAGGWADGTAKLPADGRITVLLPYPSGTGKDSHDFAVVHLFNADGFGKTAGDMESPRVTKTSGGLQVTMTGLSPVAVGWSAIPAAETKTDTKKNAARTADDSHMTLWVSAAVLSAAAAAVVIGKKREAK